MRSNHADIARICAAGLIGVFLTVLLLVDVHDGTDQPSGRSRESGAEAITLSEYELLSRAERLGIAAYWVGRRPQVGHFELEKEPNGNLYIRYLADDGGAGGRRSKSLTVASYPIAEAQQLLEHAARAKGKKLSHLDGFVMLGSSASYEAYVVFDELPELQVEIYSPQRGEAVNLARSGALTPLHWTPLD